MQYASLSILKLVDTKNYNQEKIEALLSDFRRKYAGLFVQGLICQSVLQNFGFFVN
jgi:hypothetical protein